jgi:hypothetical protein
MTFGFKNLKIPPPDFDSEDPKHPFISDKRGEVTITATAAFDAKFTEQPEVPVYVFQKDRQLIAEIELRRSDFNRKQPLVVRLAPACIVRGSLTSVGLAAGGKHLSWTNAIAFKPGMMQWYTVQCMSEARTFNLPLPPGDYGLEIYGTDCNAAYRYFHIAPGQTESKFQLDLPPDTITQLVGHPAPEPRQIKGWINGGPVKLADLRGNVVLLDFWVIGAARASPACPR